MTKFGSKEEILKSIETHFSMMSEGKLSLEDLELLVEQSRELYERMLVLRFKAYEEKVFGEAKAVLAQQDTPIDGTVFEHSVEVLTEQEVFHPEIQLENQSEELEEQSEIVLEHQDETSATEESIFDFDLFNEEPEITFGVADEIELNSTPTSIEEEISTDNIEPEVDQVSNANEQLVEETVITEQINQAEVQHFATHQEPSDDAIFDRILQKTSHLASSNLMNSRLLTLLGAFGFNEKYQCIQELFKGSTDDFNQAVDVLDNMQTFDEAKRQLHYYVKLYAWDLDSETTAEFVRKIERRFRS